VAALYIGLNVVFVYAMPLESMKGVVAIGSLAATHLFGPAVAGAFGAAMMLSLLATINAEVTIGPRVYYAMAKNGAFFGAAARVHPRWRTPAIAILCQGLCSMIMTMTPFVELLLYIGFLLNFFAVLSVVSLFVFRRRPGWTRLPVVSFAYPAVPVFFIVVGTSMTIFGITYRPATAFIAILTLAAGALVYHLRVGTKAP
jgi:APA family basic amino acid/polyamine antiporter